MERKIEAVRRMIAFCRTVPDVWAEHDNLAKNTPGGLGIHAAILDRDIGPLLQVQKLLNSVQFARSKGHKAPLDRGRAGNDEFHRRRQRPRHGPDAAGAAPAGAHRKFLPAAGLRAQSDRAADRYGCGAVRGIDAKMDQASQSQGAKDLAAAFAGAI